MSVTPAVLIAKKRDGHALTAAEIESFVRGLQSGEFADYQTSALLMAVFFRGMSLDETVALTRAMTESGERYDLSRIPGKKVDKHSTGGVGDKVSLVLAPLGAACGLRVPMMSGRGLGHTGGTLDKLAAIPGFVSDLPRERFEAVLGEVGCAMIGQSTSIAPADRRLYALRDVTGTVECIPLICGSILSKKLAEGADALVLDIKVGSGAFMKSREQARKLAKTLIQVAGKLGLPCRALLTDMNQPLGSCVGNALEVQEAIDVLRGRDATAQPGPKGAPHLREGAGHLWATPAGSCDLREVTIQLCAHMLELGQVVRSVAEGRRLASSRLSDGSAWNTFEKMVAAQGGRLEAFTDPLRSPPSGMRILSWKAKKRGYIARVNTETVGRLLVELGGGRKKVSDTIDPRVGLVFHRKLGARVDAGDPLVTVYAPPASERADLNLEALEAQFREAVEVRGQRRPVPKLVQERPMIREGGKPELL